MTVESTEEEPLHVDPEDDVKMTIWEHLGELRKRIVRAAIALGAGSIVCWIYREELFAIMAKPYEEAWYARFPTTPVEIQTLAPIDVLVNYLQLAMTGGVVLAAPVIFYQLWAFISPGLYSREKRYIIPFVVFSTGLFGLGLSFCYYAFFPAFFNYSFSLLGKIGEGPGESGILLTSRPTMEFYFDFATRMLLAFGFIFEMPLFIAFLALAGIVTPRQLVRFTRWAIIGSFILGAFITPGPEVSSQIIVSSAITALYFVSIGLAFIVAPRRKKEDEASS